MRNTKYQIPDTRYCAGFGLMEILVAAAIVGVALTTLAGVVQSAFRVTDDDVLRAQAVFLAEEGLEIARLLRDAGWEGNIAPLEKAVPHYAVFSPEESAWSLSLSDPGPIDGVFTREVIFNDAYRRTADDDLVLVGDPAPKTVDEGTVRVTARISWAGRKSAEEFSVETYLADLFGN